MECESFDIDNDQLYLDCSKRDLTNIPDINYSPFSYINMQSNYIYECDVSDWPSQIWDFRFNPDTEFLCDNIGHVEGQIIYPCDFEDEYEYENDREKSEDKHNDTDHMLPWRVFAWCLLSLVFVGVVLFAAIRSTLEGEGRNIVKRKKIVKRRKLQKLERVSL